MKAYLVRSVLLAIFVSGGLLVGSSLADAQLTPTCVDPVSEAQCMIQQGDLHIFAWNVLGDAEVDLALSVYNRTPDDALATLTFACVSNGVIVDIDGYDVTRVIGVEEVDSGFKMTVSAVVMDQYNCDPSVVSHNGACDTYNYVVKGTVEGSDNPSAMLGDASLTCMLNPPTPTTTTSTTTVATGGGTTFWDVGLDHLFYAPIERMDELGLTKGCGTTELEGIGEVRLLFCPDRSVSRAEMATFLRRTLPDLPIVKERVDFKDDDGMNLTGFHAGCLV